MTSGFLQKKETFCRSNVQEKNSNNTNDRQLYIIIDIREAESSSAFYNCS